MVKLRTVSMIGAVVRGCFFHLPGIVLTLSATCVLVVALGCNEYNPYLGATPTVSSSITSITPSGVAAGHGDIFLTVSGSGFVAGSDVTWNSSNSVGTNLVSNFVSANEMQANIPSALLTTPGTFFVGVIAPGTGPNAGNNAGENISNFLPFVVCSASGCPSAVNANSTNKAAARVTQLSVTIPRYQVFLGSSSDMWVDVETGISRVFLRDSCLGAARTCTPEIFPVSVAWNGADPNGASFSASATPEGRFVVFASEATNLVKGDSNGWSDIFLRDTCIGAASPCVRTTTRISVGPDSAEADAPSSSPAISPDGRFVAFHSLATNLVQPQYLNSLPTTAKIPLFLRDTCFGAEASCVPKTSRVIPASALQHE